MRPAIPRISSGVFSGLFHATSVTGWNTPARLPLMIRVVSIWKASSSASPIRALSSGRNVLTSAKLARISFYSVVLMLSALLRLLPVLFVEAFPAVLILVGVPAAVPVFLLQDEQPGIQQEIPSYQRQDTLLP